MIMNRKKERVSEGFIKSLNEGLKESVIMIEYWRGRKAAFTQIIETVELKGDEI